MAEKQIKALCAECSKKTNHQVLFRQTETPPEEYDYNAKIDYSVIKCCGCDNISFLYEFHDYENRYYNDETGHEDYLLTVNQYPRIIEGYSGFKEVGYLPPLIKQIYTETLDALKNESMILTGIGLRAIIEAITKQENIPGKNLDTKISNLSKNGFLSKKDADRLHAIRFMGNDAAHEIIAYEKNKVILGFEIIENVLKTLYVLDRKTDFFLVMPIKDYSDFVRLIKEKLSIKVNRENTNEFTIRSLLGNDIRRTLDKLDQYEQELQREINANTFTELVIARQEQKNGKNITYYKNRPV